MIAKLDRLRRDAHFLLGLEKAGVDFVAADMPTANRLTVGIMAMVADEERRLISKRTKKRWRPLKRVACGSEAIGAPSSRMRRGRSVAKPATPSQRPVQPILRL